MAYISNTGKSVSSVDNFGLSSKQSSANGNEFHELEPAIILDIILDSSHPIFKIKSNVQTVIDVDRWPADLNGNKPSEGDVDYTWIGRALVRLRYSSPTTQKDKLTWAYPLESNISEYPLINEMVMVISYNNKYYYTRKLNLKNLPNQSVDFSINKTLSGTDNTELYSNQQYAGPKSKTNTDGTLNYVGVVGKYFKINNNIRSIKRYEGDLTFESRFGQSIRFGTYDDNRDNDIGIYPEYKDSGGNPMIIIRNRQRKLLGDSETLKLKNSPNPATIIGTSIEKNAGGFIKEDINHDGSSIYITSGKTISKWVTTCYKGMFGIKEEVSSFSGQTDFKYPKLLGDQIIINTDRLILSARYGEFFNYSKKRYGIVTDSEFSLDAHNQIVISTNTKTVINSPAIYLGEYDNTNEPAVLGQTLCNWLYDLCNWISEHTHWHEHSHVDAGAPSPEKTQIPVQIQKLFSLRDQLNTILSRRVFITGGGFAPGQNGGSIENGSTPIKISVSSGNGVPGGWKGQNKR